MTRQISSEVITRVVAGSSLEFKLTDAHAFGLVTASPLQRAICRAADGVPLGDLALDEVVQAAFGDVSGLPRAKPKEIVVLSGIRAAKSLIAGCGAVHMALTCDVSSLRPGEIPRVAVVSTQRDNAAVIMDHIVGTLERSPLLRRFLAAPPTSDGILLRHPSGTIVEIRVVAGSRAGSTLVSRWSAGCIFDEFPRMVGGDGGVVNWDDMREAVIHRLLAGCQIWHIGSPWAPYGPAYELCAKYHGKPTAQLVVVRAPAPAMNPVLWTPARCAEAKATNEDAYRTDVLAEFATPEEAMYSSESVDKCTRKNPVIIGRETGHTYYAAMDPATRGNGWTFAIATRSRGKTVVVRAEEWIGSRNEPLDPGDVLAGVAEICADYGITTVHSDQVMGDALVKLARQQGLMLAQWTYSGTERAKKYLAIRTHLDRGDIELPPLPQMRTDLLHIRKQITPAGMQPKLPMTSDGRHCDWGPTLMLVLSRLLPEADGPKRVTEDSETTRLRKQVMDRFARKDTW